MMGHQERTTKTYEGGEKANVKKETEGKKEDANKMGTNTNIHNNEHDENKEKDEETAMTVATITRMRGRKHRMATMEKQTHKSEDHL